MDLLHEERMCKETSAFCSPLQLCFDPISDDVLSPLTKYSQRTYSEINQDEDSRDSGIGFEDFPDESSPLLIKRPFAGIKRGETKKRLLEDDEEFPITKKSKLDPSPLRQDYKKVAKDIKSVLDNVAENPNLISDGSASYRLPTTPGKHSDLKSISPATLTRLLNHEFQETVDHFVIVDCRYPYEYQGGHIDGAVNCYTKDSITESFISKPITNSQKKPILIFHCEFSSERGPKMCRFLRQQDREANKNTYPELYYPEVYILDGGYKLFFNKQQKLCVPPAYVPMHADDYRKEMRTFRAKSKSWSGEKKPRSVLRRLF